MKYGQTFLCPFKRDFVQQYNSEGRQSLPCNTTKRKKSEYSEENNLILYENNYFYIIFFIF